MSDGTAIEWTDATWNPTTGCTKVSPGCAHCYIERAASFRISGRKFDRGAIPVELHPERLEQPMKWRKPRRVFVNSLSDLFHEDVPDEFIAQVFGIMKGAPQHTFQVLTKRPDRMRDWLSRCKPSGLGNGGADWITLDGEEPRGYQGNGVIVGVTERWPLPNVWLGVSVENQRWADERIPLLLQTPAAVRFISAEPLLGPVDLSRVCSGRVDALAGDALTARGEIYAGGHGLDWVIVGGESGPRARSLDLAWVERIREQCAEAGVAYFGKQAGGTRPGIPLPGRLGDREFPR